MVNCTIAPQCSEGVWAAKKTHIGHIRITFWMINSQWAPSARAWIANSCYIVHPEPGSSWEVTFCILRVIHFTLWVKVLVLVYTNSSTFKYSFRFKQEGFGGWISKSSKNMFYFAKSPEQWAATRSQEGQVERSTPTNSGTSRCRVTWKSLDLMYIVPNRSNTACVKVIC